MKLVTGVTVYLATVAALIGAIVLGWSDIVPTPSPVLASDTDAVKSAATTGISVPAEIDTDRNRVPVWIVPTAKYNYTPPDNVRQIRARPRIVTDQRHKKTRKKDARDAIETALGSSGEHLTRQSLGYAGDRRDNNPFHRD